MTDTEAFPDSMTSQDWGRVRQLADEATVPSDRALFRKILKLDPTPPIADGLWLVPTTYEQGCRFHVVTVRAGRWFLEVGQDGVPDDLTYGSALPSDVSRWRPLHVVPDPDDQVRVDELVSYLSGTDFVHDSVRDQVRGLLRLLRDED